MNWKQKLVQRHKNPFGLALRVITYFLIGYGLWVHKMELIMLLVLLDLMNWFWMPMVKPEYESKMINTIVEKEIVWLKSPFGIPKCFSILTGVVLVVLLVIALWERNRAMLLTAFICLIVLKQLLLKTATSFSGNHR